MSQRVADSISKLFHAFGMVTAERVAAFVETISEDLHCPVCITFTAKKLAKTAPKMVTPAQFIGSYREVYEVEHYRHVGQTSRVAEVGIAESFWRREAPKVIAEVYGCGSEQAVIIAAQMWSSTCVAPLAESVRIECETTRIWLASSGNSSGAAAFDRARAIATTEPARMSDEQWGAL